MSPWVVAAPQRTTQQRERKQSTRISWRVPFERRGLLHAGERRDEERRPLRTEIAVRAIDVVLAERVRALRATPAADPDAWNAKADRDVRIRARRRGRGR